MSSRFIRVLTLSCCFLASVVSFAAAAPGDVDRSFGEEGIVSLEEDSAGYTVPDDMAVGPGGAIYTLKALQECSTARCTLAYLVSRFRPSGALDSSFGTAGTSTIQASAQSFQYGLGGLNASLGLASDGRVVIASTNRGKLMLWRLNPEGSVDGGVGVAGVAEFDLGTPVGRAKVAVQGDGKIVVAAEPEAGYEGNAVLVARYTTQGAPDSTFHGGTPVVTSLGSGFGGFALTSTEQPLLAGPRCCFSSGRAIHLARLDQNGSFDSSFGLQGQRFVDDVTDGVGVGAVVALPNGRIYVVGSGRKGGNSFALRLLSSGKLDHKFGHRGIAYMRHSFLYVRGAAVDRAGRLLVFGTAPVGSSRGPRYGSNRLTVLRRLSDGRRDPTFAGGSLVRLRSLGPTRVAAGGLQSGNGLVILASRVECIRTCPPPNDFLVRFLGGTSGSRCQGHRATIVGTRHGEKLVGTRGPDVIAALAGNDLVRGRGGNDLICGGRGDDRLAGGRGRDVLRGGAGRNHLSQ